MKVTITIDSQRREPRKPLWRPDKRGMGDREYTEMLNYLCQPLADGGNKYDPWSRGMGGELKITVTGLEAGGLLEPGIIPKAGTAVIEMAGGGREPWWTRKAQPFAATCGVGETNQGYIQERLVLWNPEYGTAMTESIGMCRPLEWPAPLW